MKIFDFNLKLILFIGLFIGLWWILSGGEGLARTESTGESMNRIIIGKVYLGGFINKFMEENWQSNRTEPPIYPGNPLLPIHKKKMVQINFLIPNTNDLVKAEKR